MEFAAADEGKGGIADMCESDRRVAGADPASVFGEGPVADAEQPVLDLPVIAGECQHGAGVHRIGRDGRDGVDDLARAQGPGFAQPLDPDDAGRVGPEPIEPRRRSPDGDPSDLDATMAAVDLLGAAQIRRIDRLVSLSGAAGEA
jgi:hypothetical protein